MAPSDVYGMEDDNSLEKVSVVLCAQSMGFRCRPSTLRKKTGQRQCREWALCFGRSRSHHGVRNRHYRLRINDLTPTDAPALFTYRSHERVARFQSWLPDSVDDARASCSKCVRKFDQRDSWYQFAIRSAVVEGLIGDLGVHFLADGHQVEIGVTIAPPHQRKLFGASAAIALLDHLFTVMNKHRVWRRSIPQRSVHGTMRLWVCAGGTFAQSLLWRGNWWTTRCSHSAIGMEVPSKSSMQLSALQRPHSDIP